MPAQEFSVYIVRCGDETYYTGIATDVERRMSEHAKGSRGAKYLQGRGPLTLVLKEPVGDRSLASKVEYRIKRLDRRGKEALLRGQTTVAELIASQDSDGG